MHEQSFVHARMSAAVQSHLHQLMPSLSRMAQLWHAELAYHESTHDLGQGGAASLCGPALGSIAQVYLCYTNHVVWHPACRHWRWCHAPCPACQQSWLLEFPADMFTMTTCMCVIICCNTVRASAIASLPTSWAAQQDITMIRFTKDLTCLAGRMQAAAACLMMMMMMMMKAWPSSANIAAAQCFSYSWSIA